MIRLIGYFFGLSVILFFGVVGVVVIYFNMVMKDLFDYEVLVNYVFLVMICIYVGDGQFIVEYVYEWWFYLFIQVILDCVKVVFIFVEDKNFYSYFGFDFMGLGCVIFVNLQNVGSGCCFVGVLMIMQQVVKNFLFFLDQMLLCKVKEVILLLCIEQIYLKDCIFEFYFNEIFFGLNFYGIVLVVLIYFDKLVIEFLIVECVYLVLFFKGFVNYNFFCYFDVVFECCNWVIDCMVENGYVVKDDGDVVKKELLGVIGCKNGIYFFVFDYFVEEVCW